jgi:CheY-like chemotaxis protein
MLLRLSGHEVKVLTEATEVLQSASVFAPHVAVLDIGLPGIDGYELARQLRGLDGGANLVLIALTGYGQPQDRTRSRAAGFDYHFIKPVEPVEFEIAVQANPLSRTSANSAPRSSA